MPNSKTQSKSPPGAKVASMFIGADVKVFVVVSAMLVPPETSSESASSILTKRWPFVPSARLSKDRILLHSPAKQMGTGMRKSIIALLTICQTIYLAAPALAQPVPAPQMVPGPGPVTKGPYQPQAILPGGIVMPLYPAGSPFLNAKRVSEAEKYTMDPLTPGRVQRIVNIHNPSIEVHLAGAN